MFCSRRFIVIFYVLEMQFLCTLFLLSQGGVARQAEGRARLGEGAPRAARSAAGRRCRGHSPVLCPQERCELRRETKTNLMKSKDSWGLGQHTGLICHRAKPVKRRLTHVKLIGDVHPVFRPHVAFPFLQATKIMGRKFQLLFTVSTTFLKLEGLTNLKNWST